MRNMFKKTVGFVLGLYVGGFIIGVIDQMILEVKEPEEKTSTNSEEEES